MYYYVGIPLVLQLIVYSLKKVLPVLRLIFTTERFIHFECTIYFRVIYSLFIHPICSLWKSAINKEPSLKINLEQNYCRAIYFPTAAQTIYSLATNTRRYIELDRHCKSFQYKTGISNRETNRRIRHTCTGNHERLDLKTLRFRCFKTAPNAFSFSTPRNIIVIR